MTFTKKDQKEAKDYLENLFQKKGIKKSEDKKPIIYIISRFVSRTGMSRYYSCYVIVDGEPVHITYRVAETLNWSYNDKYEAVIVKGAGMDMGFHLVNTLSYTVHGFGNEKSGYTLDYKWL